jgi:hypothetical protein
MRSKEQEDPIIELVSRFGADYVLGPLVSEEV